MSITQGTRIGAYEVTTQIGEGGMGVVFRARDTRLLRDVALKLLPEHFADDPDRLSRFQREAQVLASLNHPNIAQIYGLEHVGNSGCIVMELVEGETLAERLKTGPLKHDEAIEIAKQIANALAAAHERGIIHRDLKPANIKLTPNGTVKVLDFGLAKALDRASETDLSNLPTKVSGSMAGMVVGTAGYMSPEQARGREVDPRTDIWAFGCVLFEMLTARQAFEGETATDMIAKIVTSEPDLSLLPVDTPPSIRLLLQATLNKSAQQRLQHIGDMRLFLDPKLFAAPSASAVETKPGRGRLMIASLVVMLVLALIPAVLYFRSSTPVVPEMHFELGQTVSSSLVFVSPDGRRLAYVTQQDEENRAIWVRPIGSQTGQRLTGTDNAGAGIMWSPDSRYLSFVADSKLKKVDVTGGGSVQVLCDLVGRVIGITWSRQGVILFTKDAPGSSPTDNVILRVSDTGGEVKPVVTLDDGRKELLHAMPAFLPDGNHFLYVTGSGIPDNAGIFVGSLDSTTRTRVRPLPNRVNGVAYAPQGYLLLSSDALTAQRLNTDSFTLEGQPVTLADGIDGFFSVSNTGLLFYRKGSSAPPLRQLVWFDRAGKQVDQIGGPGMYGGVELSPDGKRVAVDLMTTPNRDIWVIDIARAVPSRITFDPASDWTPSWSPDGSRLIFASGRNGATDIYQKSSSGVGNDELVFESDRPEIPIHWSPNGRYVVFSRPKPGTNTPPYDTWIVDMMGEKKASPFIESQFDKLHARVSPDGRWIAYATNDSGMYQVVVQSFPDPNGGKWQITAQGGVEPKWRRDGRELYYLALDGKLMAVPVKSDRTFEAGTPAALFETQLSVNRNLPSRDRRYDVAADGRFLIATPAATAGPGHVTAVVNWTAGLAGK